MSSESGKLSLWSAVFININIMIGIGLFVNTTVLAQSLGSYGWSAYAALAFLLMPLILSIAKLVEIYPEGGFYTYARESIHPFAGFIAAWSYFTAKIASATLMVHTSTQLLQQIIPALNHVNIFAFDICIMSFFIGLNMFHMRAGKSVQTLFLCMKLIPILFVLLTGLFFFSPTHMGAPHFTAGQFIGTIPLVLFAALGFEATTSLSGNLKNARRNGPLAILLSYAIVVCLNILYQFFFYATVGEQLASTGGFLQAFPLFIATCCSGESLAYAIQGICNIAIASSALGGAFGILFSNGWNLHTLAQHGHIICSKTFLQRNRYNIPFVCIIFEGIIFLFYLFATCGNQIPLQQIAAFGSTIAYSLGVASLLAVALKQKLIKMATLASLGLVNCAFFFAASLNSFYMRGIFSLSVYGLLFFVGVTLFAYTRRYALKS